MRKIILTIAVTLQLMADTGLKVTNIEGTLIVSRTLPYSIRTNDLLWAAAVPDLRAICVLNSPNTVVYEITATNRSSFQKVTKSICNLVL